LRQKVRRWRLMTELCLRFGGNESNIAVPCSSKFLNISGSSGNLGFLIYLLCNRFGLFSVSHSIASSSSFFLSLFSPPFLSLYLSPFLSLSLPFSFISPHFPLSLSLPFSFISPFLSLASSLYLSLPFSFISPFLSLYLSRFLSLSLSHLSPHSSLSHSLPLLLSLSLSPNFYFFISLPYSLFICLSHLPLALSLPSFLALYLSLLIPLSLSLSLPLYI